MDLHRAGVEDSIEWSLTVLTTHLTVSLQSGTYTKYYTNTVCHIIEHRMCECFRPLWFTQPMFVGVITRVPMVDLPNWQVVQMESCLSKMNPMNAWSLKETLC